MRMRTSPFFARLHPFILARSIRGRNQTGPEQPFGTHSAPRCLIHRELAKISSPSKVLTKFLICSIFARLQRRPDCIMFTSRESRLIINGAVTLQKVERCKERNDEKRRYLNHSWNIPFMEPGSAFSSVYVCPHVLLPQAFSWCWREIDSFNSKASTILLISYVLKNLITDLLLRFYLPRKSWSTLHNVHISMDRCTLAWDASA